MATAVRLNSFSLVQNFGFIRNKFYLTLNAKIGLLLVVSYNASAHTGEAVIGTIDLDKKKEYRLNRVEE